MQHRGNEERDELAPRKSTPRRVPYLSRECDQQCAANDEKNAPRDSDREFARGSARRDEQAEGPLSAIPDRDGQRGRDGDGDETRELKRKPPEQEQCGNIETNEQQERTEIAIEGDRLSTDRAEPGGRMRKFAPDIAALVLRLAAGLIFIPHGWSKISGKGAGAFAADIAANYHIPSILGHLAAWSEFLGAVLLIVGLLTRLDAFLLAATMFVAAFIVQLPDALYEVPPGSIKIFVALHGIELPLALFAICLSLLLTGGGKFSLDAIVFRRFRRKS
ncbi:MAG: hypothetical protein DMF56_10175 [Acidobacteria bacterium]|nr:MAG: hypothetical protein DMF56_10175 [Acidobacteriota bacterium]